MDIKYLAIEELVKKGHIVIQNIRIDSMLADPLTKGLRSIDFKLHAVNMGIVESFDYLC